MMTITSIGFGDIAATPHNAPEQLTLTIMMLLGSLVWGNVIATFCGVMATLSPNATEFRCTMDALNRFMAAQDIPSEMQRRIREYFHQTKHLQDTTDRRALLEKMSPALAGEVALRCNQKWLGRVWFLQNAGEDFVVQIALQLQAVVFAIGEVASNGFLYIIHRGLALYGGRVITSGKVWGEDMILQSEWLVRRFCARAMTYLEVFTISRPQLMEAAEAFPETALHLRRCAIRLAARREFMRIAKARLEEAGKAKAKSTVDRLFSEASSHASPGAALVAEHSEAGEEFSLKPTSSSHPPTSQGKGSFRGGFSTAATAAAAAVALQRSRIPNARRGSLDFGTDGPAAATPTSPNAKTEATVFGIKSASSLRWDGAQEVDAMEAQHPSNSALAAQLARLEKQQTEMAGQLGTLRSYMELMLRTNGVPISDAEKAREPPSDSERPANIGASRGSWFSGQI